MTAAAAGTESVGPPSAEDADEGRRTLVAGPFKGRCSFSATAALSANPLAMAPGTAGHMACGSGVAGRIGGRWVLLADSAAAASSNGTKPREKGRRAIGRGPCLGVCAPLEPPFVSEPLIVSALACGDGSAENGLDRTVEVTCSTGTAGVDAVAMSAHASSNCEAPADPGRTVGTRNTPGTADLAAWQDTRWPKSVIALLASKVGSSAPAT
mmetsp:Transcript_111867/g.316037  ORF Transcript_111867/g.316037 Transcript_111867/m.316037 type:complete len:211 (-) Transcript_111867:108-740(-)